ncbi:MULTISPECIES: hypothetical protein [Methylobacterium]|uniref:hypothetical protein n=1 Tax=Methylobacterium TaxID=407 RepID=UPI0013EB5366|nr:hypothetical protein [Methylobacterium sp. DB0501]NGM32444.1 hypothetical protein [Methylobacterium sp. DB0501]
MDDDVAVPSPLEFVIRATPRSLQSSAKAGEAWKITVGEAARCRISQSREFTLLDRRPLSVAIVYVPPAPCRATSTTS